MINEYRQVLSEILEGNPELKEDPAFRSFYESKVFEDLWRKAALGRVQNGEISPIIQEDLAISLGFPPRLGMLPDVQMVYDLRGALGDQQAARGNPLVLRLLQNTATVVGTATATAYTVPPGRVTRIDAIHVGVDDVAGGILSTAEYSARVFLGPVAATTAASAGVVSAFLSGTTTPPDKVVRLPNVPVFLLQGDVISTQIAKVAGPDVVTMRSQVFGVEVDFGFGFSDF